MLSAYSFFRGNYMTIQGAKALLRNLCAVPELVPDLWNTVEPINRPFNSADSDSIIEGAMVPSEKARGHHVSTLTFFVRRKTPRYLLSIDLRLVPVQGTTAHNCISIRIEEPWAGGENVLDRYLLSSIVLEFPDFAKIVESSQEDSERLKEFHRAFTPNELLELLSKRTVTAPFGPYGCLENIYWFNYFGKAYVDFIGKERLSSAGWVRVEKIGDGLACYASPTIDAPSFGEQRSYLASQLEEFVWSPGCKAEDKRIPVFDFSAQEEALRNISKRVR